MPVKVIRTLSLFAVLCLAIAPAAGQAQMVEDATLRDIGLSTYWRAQLPLAADDTVVQSFLVDEALYVTTKNGTIFALVAEAGLIRWADKIADKSYTIYAPSHAWTPDGTGPVIVTTTTKIHIMDRYSGKRINSFTPAFPPGSTAIGIENELYLGSADSLFYSLSWQPKRGTIPMKRWEVRAGGPVTAAPQFLSGDSLLFASQSGHVFSCTMSDKVLNWSYRIGQAVVASPAVDETGVYVASLDRSLYKIDADNGQLLWRHRMPSPLRDAPVVVDKMVYQYCQGYGIAAINRDSGKEAWQYPNGLAFAAQDQRMVYLFANGPSLMCINHETGQANGRVSLTDAHHATVNAQSDAVFLIGNHGQVLCARPSGVSYLRQNAVSVMKERLTLPPLKKGDGSNDPFPATATGDSGKNDPLRSEFDAN